MRYLALLINGLLSAVAAFADQSPLASFDGLELTANIETIGIILTGDSLPDSATVHYRSGGGGWRTGHPLLQTEPNQMAGSLFALTAATTYEITVTHGVDSIAGSVTTQAETLTFAPAHTLYVDAAAPPGGNGSPGLPYNTIQQAVAVATASTRISIANGVYHEAVEFVCSGSPAQWIQLWAAGDSVVLDGSETVSGNVWTPDPGVANVWTTNIHGSAGYLARDAERYYLYNSLAGLLAGLGNQDVPMSEGFFISETDSILTIRCLDNPASHVWHVPRLNYAVHSHQRDWLWIEGLRIRYYGQSWGAGIYCRNASHIVIRRNTIHNITNGIYVYWDGTAAQGNDTRIEFNQVYDPPVDRWPWDAVKGTSMEGVGILAAGRQGAIVRGNYVHELFNGVYTGRWGDPENHYISRDLDAYDNVVRRIGDDAFEPEGTCINNRFRDNIIDSTLVGISLAPITVGPTWVLRNRISNFFGTWIKFSSGGDGVQLIYHNTSWHDLPNHNGLDFSGPAHNSTMRNNICRSTRYAFEVTFTGNTGHDWDWDNWYTTTSAYHFKWENVRYQMIAILCAATGLECHGHEAEPGLRDPAHGNLALLPTSMNIDAGVRIPGINDDFAGPAPDIGAVEYQPDSLPDVADLTARRAGADVILRWSYPLSPMQFTIYSATDLTTPTETLRGTTATTTYILTNEVLSALPKQYYFVVASTPLAPR
jgi:hypothetical protein